jgi:hypothetical protein
MMTYLIKEGDNNSLCDAGGVEVFHDITGLLEQKLDSWEQMFDCLK